MNSLTPLSFRGRTTRTGRRRCRRGASTWRASCVFTLGLLLSQDAGRDARLAAAARGASRARRLSGRGDPQVAAGIRLARLFSERATNRTQACKEKTMKQEPSDPVERADQRRHSGGDDVTIKPDGTVEQRVHGNMDETMVPKGKEHPEEGPYVPEHDHLDPDLEPASGSQQHVKKDLEA
jgi:hypothetical protein